MYKKALSSFFLKVHPDFFHFNYTYQRTNENAVAQLNELLGWAKEFKNGTFRPPPSTPIHFTFYRKIDETEQSFLRPSREGGEGQREEGRATKSQPTVATLTSTFELPQHFKLQESNRGMVERSVNKFLRDLLRRAECIDDVTQSISAAEDRTLERIEEKPLRRRPVSKRQSLRGATRRGTTTGSGESKLDKEEAESPYRTLLDEAADSFTQDGAYFSAYSLLPRPPTVEELVESDQIFFSKDLSPMQCSSALYTLVQYLPEMQYYRWDSTPVVISDRFAVGRYGGDAAGGVQASPVDVAPSIPQDAPQEQPREMVGLSGGITIPWDFTLPQFLSFLDRFDASLALSRKNVKEEAEELERLMGTLCHALRWDDVLLSCRHSDARPTLLLLSRHVAQLSAVGITDLTVELGYKYGTRANGVVLVNVHHLVDAVSLEHWITAVQPKLALQKDLYRVTKQLLQTTLWYKKEVERVLELGTTQIDLFNHNECTYAQRLMWIKELFRVSAGLAQWDWSGFTFILGPSSSTPQTSAAGESEDEGREEEEDALVDLNWDQKTFMLPFSMDGDALLRYVELIQQEAKEKQRNAMLEAQNLQRVQKAKESDAQHRHEMLLTEDGEVADSGAAEGSSGSEPCYRSPPTPVPSVIPSAEDILYSQESSILHQPTASTSSGAITDSFGAPYSQPHRREGGGSSPIPPYLEEYMTSTRVGSPDPLSVERPLHHAVQFNSDAEAEDQLKWEGFYHSPIVDQVPTGDLDDISHAYHLTNRSHREAAAKKLLEELQGTYGKKSRRFDYQKMGDVLEINNAKVQPKGFPVLARGVKPGSS